MRHLTMKRVLFVLGVLEDEDVDWLITSGERQELQPGDRLIQEGQPCSSIFLVLDGMLEVNVTTPTGQTTAIAQLVSGEVVGEMSFVDGHLPSASVIAQAATVVLAIPMAAVEHKLEQDSGFAARFYRAMAMLLSSRLRSTVKHLQGEHWRPAPAMADAHQQAISDMVSVGSIRFDWMLKRMRDLSSNPWEALEQNLDA